LLSPVSSGSRSGVVLLAIGDLPEDEQETLDAVRVRWTTKTEAAQSLGVSAATVKRRLGLGPRLLAEQLADVGPRERPPDPI
jgi:DNA-directed RNA polymerase specialized sigma24 family protein